MRRAIALATATMAWVLLIQAASMAMAPPTVVELSPVDVSQDFGDNELTFATGAQPHQPVDCHHINDRGLF